jgi:glycosyltransferase involved in cell wall biosynthesis
MPPLASVVIPCYNSDRYLEETLHSVDQQTYPNLEVILIDDGSTDDSTSIIKQYARTKQQHADEVVCHFGPNQGVSTARTIGTNLSSGVFVQYLDADDLLRPEALERRINALEATGGDVAYSAFQRLVPADDGSFSAGGTVRRRIDDVHPDPEIATFRQFWLPPAALTYRREIVEKIGGWNKKLPIIQDARFLQDAAFYGGEFVGIPEVLADYRDHDAGSLSSSDSKSFNRDIWVNAREVEDRWRERDGSLSEEQKHALSSVYDHCARSFFGVDRVLYEQAVARIDALTPGAFSDHLARYETARHWFGYGFSSRAETLRETVVCKIKAVLRPLYYALPIPLK